MANPERIMRVAGHESVSFDLLYEFNKQVERLFGADRSASYSGMTLTGIWVVSLNRREGNVDFVDFTTDNSIPLKEITSKQQVINRASVGIGNRTVRATTETIGVTVSDNATKNEDMGGRRINSFTNFNIVTVWAGLVIDPSQLTYYPEPRSAEHVQQIVTGATEILQTLSF